VAGAVSTKYNTQKWEMKIQTKTDAGEGRQGEEPREEIKSPEFRLRALQDTKEEQTEEEKEGQKGKKEAGTRKQIQDYPQDEVSLNPGGVVKKPGKTCRAQRAATRTK